MMSEVEVKEQFYAGQWKICFMQDNNESPEDYMYKQKVWVDLVVEIVGNWENIPRIIWGSRS